MERPLVYAILFACTGLTSYAFPCIRVTIDSPRSSQNALSVIFGHHEPISQDGLLFRGVDIETIPIPRLGRPAIQATGNSPVLELDSCLLKLEHHPCLRNHIAVA
jgi:hypothetical protein